MKTGREMGGLKDRSMVFITYGALNIESRMYCLSRNAVNHWQILSETLLEVVDNLTKFK